MKRIGVLGNGQLGRMLILKAHEMGLSVIPYGPDKNSPAAQVSPHEINASYENEKKLKEFSEQVDIATVEFENIPLSALEFLADRIEVHPSPTVVWVCQNRTREKEWLNKNGFPIVPTVFVNTREELLEVSKKVSFPFVIKTAGFGYDGKGQTQITSEKDLLQFDWKSDSYVVEKWIRPLKEGSVIVCQNETGTSYLGPFENKHANHILDITHYPSHFSTEVKNEMIGIAKNIAQKFQLKGILCVEFFVENDRTVYVNEMAPRPHNSGHLTIEAFESSQYEQHLRAILGLPHAENKPRVPAAAMANLLGDLWSTPRVELTQLLHLSGVHLHWYGKEEARPGRKMGHLTAVSSTADLAVQAVKTAREAL